jgi:CRP-like cAMP-binding protein
MGGKSHLEVALAGNEGFHGVCVAMGVAISPVQALVQGGGLAWRMGEAAFRRELAQVPALRSCVDRYIYVLMSQLIKTAGCSRFHHVEQRVARWLLMTSDRAHSPSFHITHELLAYMLGVRRVGITEAASALQDRKLISYARGAVTIRDRKGLERASCSCYRSDLSIYDRFLG